MPFIKFTEIQEDASGDKSRFVYVNVDSIVKATYLPEKKHLVLILNILKPNNKSGFHESVTLTGDEAAAALEILKSI